MSNKLDLSWKPKNGMWKDDPKLVKFEKGDAMIIRTINRTPIFAYKSVRNMLDSNKYLKDNIIHKFVEIYSRKSKCIFSIGLGRLGAVPLLVGIAADLAQQPLDVVKHLDISDKICIQTPDINAYLCEDYTC